MAVSSLVNEPTYILLTLSCPAGKGPAARPRGMALTDPDTWRALQCRFARNLRSHAANAATRRVIACRHCTAAGRGRPAEHVDPAARRRGGVPRNPAGRVDLGVLRGLFHRHLRDAAAGAQDRTHPR